MKHGESTSFIIALISCVGLSGGLYWLFQHDHYFLVGLGVLLLLVDFVYLLRLFFSARKKTTFMFNALENNDFTFRFQEDFRSNSDRMLNASLNRIKDILGKAKTEAMEREKYYELIMNCVDTAIIVLDDRGMVYQTNNEALQLLGLTTFTHIQQLSTIDPALVEAFSNAQPGDRLQRTFHNERGVVTLAAAVSSMKVGDKHVRIIAANDINSSLDEKEIESWSRLIRVLTHEIMNSITPITSLSDTLIHMNSQGDPQITQGLEVISTTSKSLIAFVDSYRRLTRIPTPVKKPFYVKPFLERYMKLVFGAHNVTGTLTMPDAELLIYADEDLIGQVVINLMKNGLQAAESAVAAGKVTAPVLSVNAYSNARQEVLLEFSDNGGGIAPEIVQNMFVPFFTTKAEGSGIGLSLSRQVMRLHNASLQLTCNTKERTTFTLCF